MWIVAVFMTRVKTHTFRLLLRLSGWNLHRGDHLPSSEGLWMT